MKKLKFLFITTLAMLSLNACSSDDDSTNGKDDIKPTIDFTIENAFPTSCATVKRGGTIPFKALFTDNQQLGAYSISIHNNFDHHSHDTEVGACPMDAKKVPVSPWVATLTYNIPENSKEFIATQTIQIPNDIDTGDYHFMIQLADAVGWATMRGISFKIVE